MSTYKSNKTYCPNPDLDESKYIILESDQKKTLPPKKKNSCCCIKIVPDIYGEMLFEGDTTRAKQIGNDYITDTISINFKALTGLTAGYLNDVTFTATGNVGFVNGTGDFLTIEKSGIYLCNYAISFETTINSEIIMTIFVNGSPVNRSTTRSYISTGKRTSVSKSYLTEFIVGDVIDFRMKVDTPMINVDVCIYHAELNINLKNE